MKVTILGCGGSGGVPSAAGAWGSCDPLEPRNNRTRASILVEEGGTTLLVDTSPDLRQQLLRAAPSHIDAILYTHAHADHTHGFDDIRYLNLKQMRSMDIYGDKATLAELRRRFAYAYEPKPEGQFFRPSVIEHEIETAFSPVSALTVGALNIQPFVQDHGYSQSLGFRFGPIAYSTDVKGLDEIAFAALRGVKIWIVDAVRDDPHPVHSHVAQTLEWIDRLKPDQAYLTHMNHTLDYKSLAARLPSNVEPAYDGLVINI